mmetsp:Transcript_34734/g.80608  ORF Transcript_34734/g.80608 Transcript_34734/m.80608 type:complete len:235 (+) Transcript_34734:254-958(+)
MEVSDLDSLGHCAMRHVVGNQLVKPLEQLRNRLDSPTQLFIHAGSSAAAAVDAHQDACSCLDIRRKISNPALGCLQLHDLLPGPCGCRTSSDQSRSEGRQCCDEASTHSGQTQCCSSSTAQTDCANPRGPHAPIKEVASRRLRKAGAVTMSAAPAQHAKTSRAKESSLTMTLAASARSGCKPQAACRTAHPPALCSTVLPLLVALRGFRRGQRQGCGMPCCCCCCLSLVSSCCC